MPMPRPPVKTKLGIEALRKRTHGLSQRHRTTLFLVDGQRPLSEVLTLTQQAGAHTAHFTDLVQLGLIDAGFDASAMAVEASPERQPAGAVPETLDPSPAQWPVVSAAADLREPLTLRTDVEADVLARQRAAEQAELDALHQEVRGLLIDTLRIDAPLFAAITLVRVRRAQTARELINLVWDIERYLVASKKSPAELATLYRARELLGMGNTHVSTDEPAGLGGEF